MATDYYAVGLIGKGEGIWIFLKKKPRGRLILCKSEFFTVVHTQLSKVMILKR